MLYKACYPPTDQFNFISLTTTRKLKLRFRLMLFERNKDNHVFITAQKIWANCTRCRRRHLCSHKSPQSDFYPASQRSRKAWNCFQTCVTTNKITHRLIDSYSIRQGFRSSEYLWIINSSGEIGHCFPVALYVASSCFWNILCYVSFLHSLLFYCVLMKNQHKNHLILRIRSSPCSTLFTFEVISAYDAAWPLCVFWPSFQALEAGRKTDGGCTGPLSKFNRKESLKSISKHEDRGKWATSPLLRKMHFICSSTDTISDHKLLGPLCSAHLSYMYDVCVWSLTIMGHDLWFTRHCVPEAAWWQMAAVQLWHV